MSVDVTHLVLEAPGDTDDKVVDDGADGTEGGDTLAGAVVHLNGDKVLLGAPEGDGNVREILGKLAYKEYSSMPSDSRRRNIQGLKADDLGAILGMHTSGTLNGHDSRTNVNLHYRGIRVSLCSARRAPPQFLLRNDRTIRLF